MMKINTPHMKTSIAGIIVVLLGAVQASAVDHPFPQAMHDWAQALMFVCTGLGLHLAADAPRQPEQTAGEEQP